MKRPKAYLAFRTLITASFKACSLMVPFLTNCGKYFRNMPDCMPDHREITYSPFNTDLTHGDTMHSHLYLCTLSAVLMSTPAPRASLAASAAS